MTGGTIEALATTLTYALDLRLRGLGVFRVALALHVCLGSLSYIVSSRRVAGAQTKRSEWSGVFCVAWNVFLTLPIFAVCDFTSETRERVSKGECDGMWA